MLAEQLNSLLETINPLCFKKCVTSYGTKLTNQQQDCLEDCTSDFKASRKIVQKILMEKMKIN